MTFWSGVREEGSESFERIKEVNWHFHTICFPSSFFDFRSLNRLSTSLLLPFSPSPFLLFPVSLLRFPFSYSLNFSPSPLLSLSLSPFSSLPSSISILLFAQLLSISPSLPLPFSVFRSPFSIFPTPCSMPSAPCPLPHAPLTMTKSRPHWPALHNVQLAKKM